jgi:hypothetical protein
MKTFITIFILHLAILAKSQSPIVNINGKDGSRITGAYYKDVDGLLSAYEGTYIYTNGNSILKMVLVKKVQQYNGRYYEDLIIGEYQYISNGVERVNTLSELNTVYNDQRSHNIDGNSLISNINRMWRCPLCVPGEKRLSASIRDAATNRYAEIFMRRITQNGQQVMKIKVSNVMGMPYHVNQGPPPEFSLPLGEFDMIKQ